MKEKTTKDKIVTMLDELGRERALLLLEKLKLDHVAKGNCKTFYCSGNHGNRHVNS